MRRHRPVFARIYARLSGPMEHGGMAEYRDRTLAGLSGRVLEVGAGDGANFRHYPSGVSHLVAVEPTRLDALRFPDVRLNTPVTRHLLGAAIRP